MDELIFRIRKLTYLELWGPTILLVLLGGYLHVAKGYDMLSFEEAKENTFKAKSYLSDQMSLDEKVKNMDEFKKVEEVNTKSFNTKNSNILSSLDEEVSTELVDETDQVVEESVPEEKPKVVYKKVYVPVKESKVEEEEVEEPEDNRPVYIANRRSSSSRNSNSQNQEVVDQFVSIETLGDVTYTTEKVFNANVALGDDYIYQGKTYKKNSLAVISGIQRGGQLQLRLTKIYYRNKPTNCQIPVYDQFANETLSMNNKERNTKVGDEATDLYNNKMNQAKVDVKGVGSINVGKFLKKDQNGKEYGFIRRGSVFYIK